MKRTTGSSPAVYCWGKEMKIILESVKRTTGSLEFSVVRFTDFGTRLPLVPAVNCWAIVIRPHSGLICLTIFLSA